MTEKKKSRKTRRIVGTLMGWVIILTLIVLFGMQAIMHRSWNAFLIPFIGPVEGNVALIVLVGCIAAGGITIFWARWVPPLGPMNTEEYDVWFVWQEWKRNNSAADTPKPSVGRKEAKPYKPRTTTWKRNAFEIARRRGFNFEQKFIDDVLKK